MTTMFGKLVQTHVLCKQYHIDRVFADTLFFSIYPVFDT